MSFLQTILMIAFVLLALTDAQGNGNGNGQGGGNNGNGNGNTPDTTPAPTACSRFCTMQYDPQCCLYAGILYKEYGNACATECDVASGIASSCSQGACRTTYQRCKVDSDCGDRYECSNDVRQDTCTYQCDTAFNDCGVCVKVWDDGLGNGASCGGFAGTACPTGFTCFDDDTDSCNNLCGGADCIGFCADPVTN